MNAGVCSAIEGRLKGSGLVQGTLSQPRTQNPISDVTVTWEQLGYPSDAQATVRDLHAEKDVGVFAEAFTAGVNIHDVVMVKITPLKSMKIFRVAAMA